MLTAISRYGARVLPNTEQIIAGCKARGAFIQGPQIAEFEEAFARRAGGGTAVAAAYGRVAFFYLLKALDLPPGSEIIFPALTFWVVPELAKAAGLTVVFADVDPRTFNIDPTSVERMITGKTRAIVPTHLYGLACDMDAILAIAERHHLIVLEDCAHSLGATFRGRPVGTFGTGALFSFQTLKPLNCYGGGAALIQDRALAAKVRATVDELPWPSEKRVSESVVDGQIAANLHQTVGIFDLAVSGSLGIRAHRCKPRRIPLGKNPPVESSPRGVRRALSERAGSHRSRSAEVL